MDDTDDSEDSEVMTGRIKEITVRSVSGVDKTEVTVGLIVRQEWEETPSDSRQTQE